MCAIKEIVKEMTKKHNTINPFELASIKSIHVIPWNLHHEIKGFYKYDRRNKYIFINNNLDYTTKSFVCAHELGHSQLHSRVNTPFLREKTLLSVERVEVEANTFAVELLIPDESILELQNINLTINEIADIHGVPRNVSHLKVFNKIRKEGTR